MARMSEAGTELRTFIFAGGGSGGHLSPGIAVAESLRAIEPAARPLFLCSERAIDREVLGGAGFDFVPIPAAPFSARPTALVRMIARVSRGTRASRRIMESERPAALLALGGFVSIPACRAARRLGIPIVLLNLDAVAGRANRLVAKWATRLLAAVPATGLPSARVEVVGMPVRSAARATEDPATCRTKLGLEPGLRTLFVTGASQGSTALNESIPAWISERPDLLRDWQVLHLCGPGDPARLESLRASYARARVRAVVSTFLHEIGLAWGAATLAVSRGGASSVAEAAFNHTPTIFVAFPHHRDQHQRANAVALVHAGAALHARDPSLAAGVDRPLREVLFELLAEPERIRALEEAARATPRLDAAARVAAILAGLDGAARHAR